MSDECSENSAEFGWTKAHHGEEKAYNFIGFSSSNESRSSANRTLFYNNYNIIKAVHNHPDGMMTASQSDIDFAKLIQKRCPNASFSVYLIDCSYYQYDQNTVLPSNILPEHNVFSKRDE